MEQIRDDLSVIIMLLEGLVEDISEFRPELPAEKYVGNEWSPGYKKMVEYTYMKGNMSQALYKLQEIVPHVNEYEL